MPSCFVYSHLGDACGYFSEVQLHSLAHAYSLLHVTHTYVMSSTASDRLKLAVAADRGQRQPATTLPLRWVSVQLVCKVLVHDGNHDGMIRIFVHISKHSALYYVELIFPLSTRMANKLWHLPASADINNGQGEGANSTVDSCEPSLENTATSWHGVYNTQDNIVVNCKCMLWPQLCVDTKCKKIF